jgi:hypothetical protein
MTSRFLTPAQQDGLLKVGDVLIPGDQQFPSFSRSRCAEHMDRMLAYMNESDLHAVQLLLGVFRYLPKIVLRGLMTLTDQHRLFPGPIGAALRMISIAIKGTVMTLYYSDLAEGVSIYELIRWDATIVEREPLPADPTEVR